ncbi:motility associated factor glycosyltransferase family protein [Paenibacillus hubeiensis]|uniref:motility associated factor glycosyltransferase family protein n=1 Tax=Paenibacillus hubeiensis TaxID=3077330 RepID=UPI0031BA1473
MDNFSINKQVLSERFAHVLKSNELHDFTDEELESEYFFEQTERDEVWLQAVRTLVGDDQVVFVYGFERGFAIADLIEEHPHKWFFVYEPSVKHFAKAMTEYDLSPVLSHPNLYWLSVGEDQLQLIFSMLGTYMQDRLAFIAQRHYLDLHIEDVQKIKEDFQIHRRDMLSNLFTEDRFKHEWTQNYLNHLVDAVSHIHIEQLIGKLDVETALVVSSGPSLSQDIETIKKLQQHVIIIAAGSSVQALVKQGIIPHITVIMDGHAVNTKIFSDPSTLAPTLFFTSSSFYQISDQKSSDKVYSIMRNDSLSKYFLNRSDESTIIFPVETVAGTAIQVAAALGAKRIVLAGQDLSFPEDRSYAEGVNHFAPEVTQTFVNHAHLKVTNVKGGENRTDLSFLSMKQGIEKLIIALEPIECVNTSSLGAEIKGAPFRPMESLVDELLQQPVVSERIIKDLLECHPIIPDKEDVEFLHERLSGVRRAVSELPLKIRRLNKEIDNMELYSRDKPSKAIKSFDKVVELWESIAGANWFSPLWETFMPAELAAFDRKLPVLFNEERLIKKSVLVRNTVAELAKVISENVDTMLQFLDEAIARIERKHSESYN